MSARVTRRRGFRRGLTMLEILVAASLLAIGLLASLEVIARCAATTRGAQDRARAMLFARSKMEEILKEPLLQIGTDQGQGVDTSTDYDWQASIEQSQHPSLYMVVVTAVNRVTNTRVSLTALRRPDLVTPPEGAAGTETGTGTDTGAAAGGGGSTL